MTTFDVYINGIQPEHIKNAENIKKEASKRLNIEFHEIEDILASQSACIQRSVSEKEALQYQKVLHEIGIICVYRPSQGGSELTLEALDTVEEQGNIFSCPSCHAELPHTKENIPPEKCIKCGISITKFLAIQNLEKEKEKVRQDLIRTQSIQKALSEEETLQREQEKRRKQFEKEIKEENPDLVNKKSLNLPLLLGGSSILIATILGISFISSGSNNDSSTDSDSLIASASQQQYSSSSSDATQQENQNTNVQASGSSSFNKKNITAEMTVHNTDIVTAGQQSLQNTHDQASKVLESFGLDADAFANNAAGSSNSGSTSKKDKNVQQAQHYSDTPLSAQQSLQNTHDKANQVLGAFGLDADALANTGGNSQSNKTANNVTKTQQEKNLSNINTLDNTTSGKLDKYPNTTDSSQKEQIIITHEASTDSASKFIIDFGLDNQEWNSLLLQNIDKKIKRKELQQAFQLASYITEKTKYIDALGKLLTKTNQPQFENEIISTIQSKINPLPIINQVQFFSQIGSYQLKKKGNSPMFNLAEESWILLSKTEDQLQAAIYLAVAYYKATDTRLSQKYFNIINDLSYKLQSTDSQIDARIAISRAYKDVGADSLSLKWMFNAEKLMSKKKKQDLKKIVKGYAYLDQPKTVLRITQQTPSIENQDMLIYEALKVFLNSGLKDNAINMSEFLITPTYKALSYTLIAAYHNNASKYLASAENLLNMKINAAIDKAVVSSRIAQLYARKYDFKKTNELFQITRQQIGLIPVTSKKDRVLNIIAVNYLRSLDQKVATDVAQSIQSPSINIALNKAILKMPKMISLLN